MARRDPELRRRFGEVLREARLAAGLSQDELGHRAGLHHTYVSELERGLKSPSLDALAALAGALNSPLSDLIARTE